MKYFLIGFAVWFALGFGIQLIKAWVLQIKFAWKRKHADDNDKWVYEV